MAKEIEIRVEAIALTIAETAPLRTRTEAFAEPRDEKSSGRRIEFIA